MNRRITITETRFEKSEKSTLEISGCLGDFSLNRSDEIKAVVRLSQIGDKFTVYVKAYSRARAPFRSLVEFNTIEDAVLSSNSQTALLISEGFKIVSIN